MWFNFFNPWNWLVSIFESIFNPPKTELPEDTQPEEPETEDLELAEE